MNDLQARMIGYPPVKSVKKFLKMELILKCIKNKAMNYHEISERTKMCSTTVRLYLAQLHKAGEVYIYKYERSAGIPTPYYMTGQKEDAIRPERRPISYYSQFKRRTPLKSRAKKDETAQTVVVVKRDIAASWF